MPLKASLATGYTQADSSTCSMAQQTAAGRAPMGTWYFMMQMLLVACLLGFVTKEIVQKSNVTMLVQQTFPKD